MVKVNPITLELNPQEAQELAQMIDIAIKAVGIRAAKPALNLHEKLVTAVKEAGYQVQDDAAGPAQQAQAQPQANGRQPARA